jgi:hypothetical protein
VTVEELVLLRSGDDGAERRHLVRPDMVIGSGRRCDLRLRDDGVRRNHAVIEHFSSGFSIRAVSERGEVYVNGEQTTHRTMLPGDRILIGSVELVVEATDAPIVRVPDAVEPARPSRPQMPPDPVPPQVLARIGRLEGHPPHFTGPPMKRRGSVATLRGATWLCMLVVVADAFALGLYIGSL